MSNCPSLAEKYEEHAPIVRALNGSRINPRPKPIRDTVTGRVTEFWVRVFAQSSRVTPEIARTALAGFNAVAKKHRISTPNYLVDTSNNGTAVIVVEHLTGLLPFEDSVRGPIQGCFRDQIEGFYAEYRESDEYKLSDAIGDTWRIRNYGLHELEVVMFDVGCIMPSDTCQ